MKVKETQGKSPNFFIKETKPKLLDISFAKIIDDYNFGLPKSSSPNINDKDKVQKIIKTLTHELIQTQKTQQIGGCEKCVIDKWQWQSKKVKNFLLATTQNQIFIIGSFNQNCFYIHAIEYNLGDIYKH